MGFELLEMNDDLYSLLNEVIRERDGLIAEVQRLTEERDDARNAARVFRDLYVSQVGRTYPEEYTLPWEAEE